MGLGTVMVFAAGNGKIQTANGNGRRRRQLS